MMVEKQKQQHQQHRHVHNLRQTLSLSSDFGSRINSIDHCILLLPKLTRQVILAETTETRWSHPFPAFRDEVRAKYGADPDLLSYRYLWGALCRVFSALPICVRTSNATILHGGIPTENFC
jgi:hypothetical protein